MLEGAWVNSCDSERSQSPGFEVRAFGGGDVGRGYGGSGGCADRGCVSCQAWRDRAGWCGGKGLREARDKELAK